VGGGCVHMLHTYNIIFRSRYIHSTCTWKEMRSEGKHLHLNTSPFLISFISFLISFISFDLRSEGKHLHLNSSIPEERAFFLNSSITCVFFK
jgi:hypothetical protein